MSIEAAYAAGFFDGEGTINIGVDHQFDRPHHRLIVQVSNTNFEVLDWLVSTFGGRLTRRYRVEGRKDHAKWVIRDRPAVEFLQLVRPFLIVKAAEADIAIRFGATLGRPGVRMQEGVPEERQALREALLCTRRRVLGTPGVVAQP